MMGTFLWIVIGIADTYTFTIPILHSLPDRLPIPFGSPINDRDPAHHCHYICLHCIGIYIFT